MFRALTALLLMSNIACSSSKDVIVNGEKVKLKDGVYALFQTTEGDMLATLYFDKAPITVGNFVALAEGTHLDATTKKGVPFYDGIIFHRVIPQFMIQTGDPLGNGSGDPGYKFPDEFAEGLIHDSIGILSMANAGPGTNGSQFFITETATPWLDGKHAIFGKVVRGKEIISKIANVKRNRNDKPEKDVIINHVEIIRIGQAAKAFNAYQSFKDGIAGLEEKIAKEAAEKAAAEKAMLDDIAKNALTTESGLMYIVEKKGDGAPINPGDQINVHYAGYLLDGTLFDSSIKEIAMQNNKYDPRREPYAPLPLTAGPQGQVIEGWKEGIMLFNVGGKGRLIIPYYLAYGERGYPGVIPPKATLIFDIEIVSKN